MNSDFEKDFQPIYCEKYKQQGFIFVEDIDQPTFVVCDRCGYETSQFWYPKCEMGGCFVENIEKRPLSWIYSNCRTKYILPDSFYEKHLQLYLEKDLPVEMLISVLHPNYMMHKLAVNFMGIVALSGFVSIYIFLSILHRPLLVVISFLVLMTLLIILGRWDTKLSTIKQTK